MGATPPPPAGVCQLLPSVVLPASPARFAVWGRASDPPVPPKDPETAPAMEEDQELERMKCPLAGTNKRFLINTIKNTLPSHKEQDHEQKEGSKEPTKNQAQKEENPKPHRSHPYKHSFRARGAVSYSPPRKRSTKDKREKRPSRR
ncbi:protein POLR1D isoform X3 [Nycticebus coucang]|uniref:protein POLR1D isoform X3 n=1 Tax=Nycticebus coucang TaxID=9470 RepID=UPI00234DAD44|nr:protein POLR1D isoform X3 [Nycticebus coucang]